MSGLVIFKRNPCKYNAVNNEFFLILEMTMIYYIFLSGEAMKYLSSLILVLIVLCSCDSSTDYSSGPPVLLPPVITGWVRVYETGEIGRPLGKLQDKLKGNIAEIYYMVPTPSHSIFACLVKLKKASNVSIWIVPGSSSGDFEMENMGFANVCKSGNVQSILVHSGLLEVGEHKLYVDWNKISNASGIGLFRLYVQAGDELLWTDGLHY